MRSRSFISVGFLVALAALAGGCGDSDSEQDAVARVGDVSVPQAALDRRLEAAERLRGVQGADAALPPRKQLRRQLLQALIRNQWIEQEASARGLRVTRREVAEWLEAQRQGLGAQQDLKAVEANMAMRGGAAQARSALLLEKLVSAGSKPVSDAEVRRYFERHAEELGTPNVRHINVVTTPTKAAIERAHAALQRGDSWKRVVRAYSVDRFPREHRTLWLATTKGELEPKLSRAIFRARMGEVVGPLRTASGWYLFSLSLVKKGTPATLATARNGIKGTLESRRTQQAGAAIDRELRRKYAKKTTCLGELRVPECDGSA